MTNITLKDIELFECDETGALKVSFIFSNSTKYSIIFEKEVPVRDFCNDIQAIAGQLRLLYVTPPDGVGNHVRH